MSDIYLHRLEEALSAIAEYARENDRGSHEGHCGNIEKMANAALADQSAPNHGLFQENRALKDHIQEIINAWLTIQDQIHDEGTFSEWAEDDMRRALFKLNKGPIAPIGFHRRLKELREDMCISQEELGKMCKLAPTHISHFETGFRKPSYENLRKLCNALKCNPKYLLCLDY